LSRRLAATGCTTCREYLNLLKSRPEEYDRLINSLTIKVSRFFRDPHVFRVLAREVLPRLAGAASYLCVWSAGCAQGQEAYSMAILLEHIKETRFPSLKARVVATDIDRDSLVGLGEYPVEMLAEVDSYFLKKYFRREGSRYRIRGPRCLFWTCSCQI
jgi:chemotaxis methyl-accepting protein methylase